MQQQGMKSPAIHSKPSAQAEFAERICPFVPTVRAVGVLAAVPVMIAPLPVTQAQGIEGVAAEAHVNPVGHDPQTVSTSPSAPTARAVGVFAAVPDTRVPLAVMQAQGIEGVAAAAQTKPEVQAAQAVRTCPSEPTVRATGVLAAVPETRPPLPVMHAQGMAGAAVEDQQSPVADVEQAVRT
jgi:hypothetical protein